VLIELGALLKTNNTTYNTLSNTFLNNFIALLKLLITQEINGKQAKSILENMFHTNKSPEQLIKELNFVQIKDPDIIKTYLEKYIKENPIMLNQYQQRPERVEKFFIGLLMRDTKGQANPNAAITILKKLLN
jgi:aspartyl-tRNA(Asn)/glutamyl-tRNA(Gln) amidotransferase subunit B